MDKLAPNAGKVFVDSAMSPTEIFETKAPTDQKSSIINKRSGNASLSVAFDSLQTAEISSHINQQQPPLTSRMSILIPSVVSGVVGNILEAVGVSEIGESISPPNLDDVEREMEIARKKAIEEAKRLEEEEERLAAEAARERKALAWKVAVERNAREERERAEQHNDYNDDGADRIDMTEEDILRRLDEAERVMMELEAKAQVADESLDVSARERIITHSPLDMDFSETLYSPTNLSTVPIIVENDVNVIPEVVNLVQSEYDEDSVKEADIRSENSKLLLNTDDYNLSSLSSNTHSEMKSREFIDLNEVRDEYQKVIDAHLELSYEIEEKTIERDLKLTMTKSEPSLDIMESGHKFEYEPPTDMPEQDPPTFDSDNVFDEMLVSADKAIVPKECEYHERHTSLIEIESDSLPVEQQQYNTFANGDDNMEVILSEADRIFLPVSSQNEDRQAPMIDINNVSDLNTAFIEENSVSDYKYINESSDVSDAENFLENFKNHKIIETEVISRISNAKNVFNELETATRLAEDQIKSVSSDELTENKQLSENLAKIELISSDSVFETNIPSDKNVLEIAEFQNVIDEHLAISFEIERMTIERDRELMQNDKLFKSQIVHEFISLSEKDSVADDVLSQSNLSDDERAFFLESPKPANETQELAG